ncbi:Homeodomain-like protein [Durotheca rogersii]|uniref:Homeodomain-like protein n=1 Tax=Durotheca rogersii TaxID=419775 RepID=UPI00221F11EF|nr:Homeodomain-like protein [Durotheca rogersii]KAI5856637.1 Homeodomain-like protein [Durotheca rogersii]
MSKQRRGPWSQREDDVLLRLVHMQGALNWVGISQQLQSRSAKQCRERYHQNLKPTLNHEPISPEEGALIERLVGELGKRWAEIARRLDNRSDNAVKNWWNGSMNRRKRLTRRNLTGLGGQADSQVRRCSRSSDESDLRVLSPFLSHCHGFAPPQASYHHTNPRSWNYRTGLPSPSLNSSCVESSATYPPSRSHSMASRQVPYPGRALPRPPSALPALRIGDEDPSIRPIRHPTLGLMPFPAAIRSVDLRLPPIAKFAGNGHQLPTAPSSPQDHRPKLRPQSAVTAGGLE